ncbi:cell wall-binding repeat-containing protein [Thermococcus sp. MAR1]|uniref:cell wall-binding repeat-containing protein n=1 Tax=Thermococcus sp. MAR1 TaxID=1638263 RepID=UPI00143A7D2C|nr:hypothetical protein [Thermococcus sp. MAR1]NJE10380.1 hypothetical protein [Thermococcus sp. MAR1]
MKVTKLLSILAAFLILGGAFLIPEVQAEGMVILVSDNPADYAGAKVLSLAAGGTIVTTPWGRFDENLLGKVLSARPGEVVVVGGPLAVPANYSEVLEAKGIKVTRIAGKDRAETSEMLLNWIIDSGYKPKGDVYLVDGWDEGAILYILEEEDEPIIMALPHHDLVNAIHEKSGLTSKMASASTCCRSVYLYGPTLVDKDNGNSTPCPDCIPMEIDEKKALSMSLNRLVTLSRGIPDETLRREVIERASLGKELISGGELQRAREVLMEGFEIAYSAIARDKPGPAGTSSGSTD